MFNHVDHGIKLPVLKCETTPGGRFYYPPSGEKLPSITTVLGTTADKSGLNEWRKKVGNKEAEQVGKRATIRGNIIHDI